MRFYVIYSFDIPKEKGVKSFQPPFMSKWELTEGDEQFEWDEIWPQGGKHRKYVAEDLSKEEFKKFVNWCGLSFEDIQTMGSLTNIGWLPAFSFNGNDYDAISGAYVTPFPEPVKDFHKHFNGEMLPGFEFSEAEEEEFFARKEDKYWNMMHKAMKGMFE